MIKTYTPSHFEIFDKCPKQYYYRYIQKLFLPQKDDFTELGNNIHALIRYYLQGDNIEHLLKNTSSEVLTHWNNIKSHPIMGLESIALEWGFDCHLNDNNWLRGQIDAVFYDKNNSKYIIADWKSGKNIPENPPSAFQCMIYLYAFFNAQKDLGLNFSHNDLEFQYIHTLNNSLSPSPVVYSQKKEEIYKKNFIEIISKIEKLEIMPQIKQCKDKKCTYSALC
ncbi:MAG: PD-(D/E)XK nuclease family protein [Candidatus Gastranaerophilales bacterium]|nr:PD-(D/E)XK nuclease family protein [Candidatus Gastranaerophilales bacterium]